MNLCNIKFSKGILKYSKEIKIALISSKHIPIKLILYILNFILMEKEFEA